MHQKFAGWWETNPSEKYESQLGLLFSLHICGKQNHVPHDQPACVGKNQGELGNTHWKFNSDQINSATKIKAARVHFLAATASKRLRDPRLHQSLFLAQKAAFPGDVLHRMPSYLDLLEGIQPLETKTDSLYTPQMADGPIFPWRKSPNIYNSYIQHAQA